MFYVYHKETGEQVAFHHAVDRNAALKKGIFQANPLGSKEPVVEPVVEPQEAASGIEPLEEPVPMDDEKPAPAKKESKASKIARG